MAHHFPSVAWTDAFKDAVNNNELYRKHGKAWTFGSVAMVVQADPSRGLPDDVGMILDVHEGECRGTEFLHGIESFKESPFVIVAPYERWKQVITGELDPIKAMMEGKLKLTGHLPTMLRFVESSRQLVVSASHVATEFPN